MSELRLDHQANTAACSDLTGELQETLLNSFYRLGLIDNQEKFLQDMIGDFMARMSELLNRGANTEMTLHRLNDQLAQLRNC